MLNKVIKTNIPDKFAKDINFYDCYKVELFENITKENFLLFLAGHSSDDNLTNWLSKDNFNKYLENKINIPDDIKKSYNKHVKAYAYSCEIWFEANKHIFVDIIKHYLRTNYKHIILDIYNPSSNVCTIIIDYNNLNYNIFSDAILLFIEKKYKEGINIDHLWLEGKWTNFYNEQGLKEFGGQRKYSKKYYLLKRNIIKDVQTNTVYGKYFEFDIILENIPDGNGLIPKLRNMKLKRIFD